MLQRPEPPIFDPNSDQSSLVDMAYIQDAATVYASKFEALHTAARDEELGEYSDGLRDIVLAHLLELCAVNLFRARGVYGNVSACFGHQGHPLH